MKFITWDQKPEAMHPAQFEYILWQHCNKCGREEKTPRIFVLFINGDPKLWYCHECYKILSQNEEFWQSFERGPYYGKYCEKIGDKWKEVDV